MTLSIAVVTSLLVAPVFAADTFSWRYYRPGNTGIQGDYNQAVWVPPSGDPFIGGYDPGFEEGGFARFVVGENRWENYSNVDFPIIGHPENVGTTRVNDFLPEVGAGATGKVWVATWRGALRFDPNVGPTSLERFGPDNSTLQDSMVSDADRAPDGTIWFANEGTARYNPATGAWSRWSQGGAMIAVQPKSSGGYRVVTAAQPPTQDAVSTYDSVTGQWTTTVWNPQGPAGQLVGLPGKDSVDDAGNLWAIRTMQPGAFNSLDYRTPAGAWVTPPEPYASFAFDLWAFKAFGNGQALAANGNGEIFRFDGRAWTSLGNWNPGTFTYSLDIDAAGNVWACGIGGAARRSAESGEWQRYRVTNTSNFDFFNGDIALDNAAGHVYTTANAGAGIGGMVRFDGERWTGWSQLSYGLGFEWPFLTDNSLAIACRPSTGAVAVAPSDWIYGVHEWTGSSFTQLPPLDGAKRMTEDSLGRLWAVGGGLGLAYHDSNDWTSVPVGFALTNVRNDLAVAGAVWAVGDFDLVRTDGVHTFHRTIDQFPGSSTTFTGLAIEPSGAIWVGTWQSFIETGSTLIRLDPSTGDWTSYSYDEGWPFPGQHVRPVAFTPDGKLWLHFDSEYDPKLGGFDAGLCWFDRVNVGVFQAPPAGQPQWGGMPHASIADVEVRPLADGYELWMSCPSRGIAVLTVTNDAALGDLDGDGAVGPADLALLLGAWGPCVAGCNADLDGDGAVGAADLGLLLGAWS
ncbi:MAG: hypothetical protein JNM94_06060 [Phycisphaerae bacterium]|nr:hypothetical protein [Phycisphaerae bacterium]